MTNELIILLQRTEEKHGKNFKVDHIYNTLNECISYYTPPFLRLRYLELKEELDEYVRNVNFTQSSE
jgi:hypothetical protein